MTKFNNPCQLPEFNLLAVFLNTFGIVFLLQLEKGVVVKKRKEITRTSISDIIFLIMSNTGMTREQAAITVQSILTYMKENTSEPLHKIVQQLFGGSREDEKKAALN